VNPGFLAAFAEQTFFRGYAAFRGRSRRCFRLQGHAPAFVQRLQTAALQLLVCFGDDGRRLSVIQSWSAIKKEIVFADFAGFIRTKMGPSPACRSDPEKICKRATPCNFALSRVSSGGLDAGLGPICVRNESGEVAYNNFLFNGWTKYSNYKKDRAVVTKQPKVEAPRYGSRCTKAARGP